MSLLDRYVDSVRKHLPRAQREDIASELREILQTQVEEEQSLKGRSLTGDEMGQILRKYGPPREVAARYGSHQYLIGPEVFPSYVLAVKFVLWVLAPIAAFMVLMTILIAEDKLLERVLGTLWTALAIGLFNLAVMTLVFARIGRMRSSEKDANDWDPDELWEEEFGSGASEPHEPISRSEVVGSLLGMAFLLFWWLGVNAALWRWFGWTPLPFEWTDVWTNVGYAAVPLILASIAREVIGLVQPRRIKLYVGIGVVLDLLAMPVLLRLLEAGTYVVVRTTGLASAPIRLFDKGVFVVLLLITIGVAIGIVLGARRLLRLSTFWRQAAV